MLRLSIMGSAMFRNVMIGVLLSSSVAVAAPPPAKPSAAPVAAAKPAAAVTAAKPAATAGKPVAVSAKPMSTAPAAAAIVVPATISAPQRMLIRLEILLDRAHFSPGVIDGKDGSNLKLALASYAAANGLPADTATAAITDKLVAADADMTVTRYTITDADVAGPFVEHLPTDMTELAKLDSPAYSGPVEELAERFHMDEDLFKALNPGADFAKAGTEITVAAVGKTKLAGAVTRIEVDKTAQAVRAFGDGGKLLAVYPATVGSQERPAPDGSYKVRTVAPHATYTYDPKRLTFGDAGKGKLTIKAGPNNPVGTTWIALTKPTYGIHGSPDPRLIGKRASHGCVRLTNWDIEQLAAAVKAGAVVEFTGTEQKAKT